MQSLEQDRRGRRGRSRARVAGLAMLVFASPASATVAASDSFQLQSLAFPGAAQSELRDPSGAPRASLAVVDQPVGVLASSGVGPRIELGAWTIVAVPEGGSLTASAAALGSLGLLVGRRLRQSRGASTSKLRSAS